MVLFDSDKIIDAVFAVRLEEKDNIGLTATFLPNKLLPQN